MAQASPTTRRPEARAAVARAASWVAMTRLPPLCSRHSRAVARWMAWRVPSSVGSGCAAREYGRCHLHDLDMVEKPEHRLPAARQFVIRQARTEPEAIQRSKTFRLDKRARDTVLDGRPLPERSWLAQDLAEEDRGVEIGDHRSRCRSSARRSMTSIFKRSGGGSGTRCTGTPPDRGARMDNGRRAPS